MKRRSHFLTLLLALALLLALLPLPAAYADQSGTTGACTWRLSGTTLIISGSGAMADYDDDSRPPWNCWEDDDMDSVPNIRTIRVENGVTHIGDYAFWYLSKVADVSIADTVTSVGQNAFEGTKLTALTVPRGVTVISPGAFHILTLTSIAVAPGNTAFTVRDNILYTADMTTLVQFPCGCGGDVTVPDTVTAIGPNAFDASYVTSVTMPEGLRTIGEFAFCNCHRMTEADVPSTVTVIDRYAFSGCSRLTRLTLPAGVTDFIPGTLDGLASVERFEVAPGNPVYAAYDGVICSRDLTRAVKAPGGLRGTFIAPPEMTEVPAYAFQYVRDMTGLVLHSGMTLGRGAFQGCLSLSTLVLPADADPETGTPFAACSALSDVWYSGTQSQWDALGVSGWLAKAAVHLVTGPVMAVQPSDDTVYVGQTAVFSAAVAGGDVVSVQWYYRSADGSSSGKSRMEGSDTNNLRVLAHIKGEGRQYRMVATLRSGATVTSRWATLHVNPDPYITSQPTDVTASAGGRVVFRVAAYTGTGSLTYRWQYLTPGGSVWRDSSMSGADTDTLRVSATASRNGQQYRCVVTNANGDQAISDPAALTVMNKPSITEQPGDQTAGAGAVVTFAVKAGGGGLTYQWYYRTGVSGVWRKCAGTGYDTAALTVEAKTYRNGYQYHCLVSNRVGSVYSDAATLTVSARPMITAQPRSQSAAADATVKFTVKASGADLTYQWYYRTGSTGEWKVFDGGTSATLTLLARSYRSGYQYKCRVSNDAGYVYTRVVTLTVS
ncbi:MAG: leucine-rich repeat protein [Oscillospiraceae bacterium]|nr:leucine-rich repeat protein [Oscillospiraceae bacterium]